MSIYSEPKESTFHVYIKPDLTLEYRALTVRCSAAKLEGQLVSRAIIHSVKYVFVYKESFKPPFFKSDISGTIDS